MIKRRETRKRDEKWKMRKERVESIVISLHGA
jgi:hypothetical protein